MSPNTNYDILSVIIAHNELEYVKRNVQILLEELKDTTSGIVVVDNHSSDGLCDWLSVQNGISYIVCDKEVAGYGQILEMVEKQFGCSRDVLLLRANYLLTPGSIVHMARALHSSEKIAAAGPVCGCFAGEQKTFSGSSYEEAARIQRTLKEEMVETAYLDMDVMLLKSKTLGALEKHTAIPQAAMRGYMKNVLKQGYCFAVAKQAVCFAVGSTNDEVYRAFAPSLYKQEKLHRLLYSFGDVAYQGIYLYKYLEPEILAGINDGNKFQDTKKHRGILMWDKDDVLLSTEEEAEETTRLLNHLPRKDVLFATLQLRREYHGVYIHTAMETFMASLDEERYIDLEYAVPEDDVVEIPTKNRYPVHKTTIPKIYGLREVDRRELLAFIQENYIYPLEEALELKFSNDFLERCLFKAVYTLKQRDAFMEFYREVIARVQPRVIIYSHGQDITFAYLRDTALELGIPTLEVDHGVGTVDTYHRNLVYADYLIVYSDIVARKCRELGNDRVLGIGKPGVYDCVPKAEYKYPVIVISFISSLENEIFTYARNLAERLDKQKYLIVYKAHGSEMWSEEEICQVEELGNLQIMIGGLDIREVIELSDIVVGVRSSGIFDALPYSMVKVIAMRDKADNFSEARPNEILQEVVDNGDVIMVEDEETLYQEVLNYRRNVMYRGEVNSFWIANAKERFRELVERYL